MRNSIQAEGGLNGKRAQVVDDQAYFVHVPLHYVTASLFSHRVRLASAFDCKAHTTPKPDTAWIRDIRDVCRRTTSSSGPEGERSASGRPEFPDDKQDLGSIFIGLGYRGQ